MSAAELARLLAAAVEIARGAGLLTLAHFGSRVPSAAKGDGSPVTLADREAEEFLRREIRRRFPDHGLLGEELGEEEGREPIRWILDPIDGTRSFMRGVPLYAVLVGIEAEGEAVAGVAHFPALEETVAAGRGLGCTWNGAPCRVADTARLSDALALTSEPEAVRSGAVPGWDALVARTDYVRGWGDAYGHALVATGRAEVMVDPVLAAWDAAPLLPILEEAGGRFTDLVGRATIHGGSGVSTNGVLHDEVLQLLHG